MAYAYRLKLKNSLIYTNLMIPTFTPEGVSPEPGVTIPVEQIESIQFQDLEIPTIIRNEMGEAAWSEITLTEIQSLSTAN